MWSAVLVLCSMWSTELSWCYWKYVVYRVGATVAVVYRVGATVVCGSQSWCYCSMWLKVLVLLAGKHCSMWLIELGAYCMWSTELSHCMYIGELLVCGLQSWCYCGMWSYSELELLAELLLYVAHRAVVLLLYVVYRAGATVVCGLMMSYCIWWSTKLSYCSMWSTELVLLQYVIYKDGATVVCA
ncbi:hypothetical protein Hamer_G025247, partial [Homarus americanus]